MKLPSGATPAECPTVDVSVIVPAHNVEPFIAETLRSILRQSLRSLETIVVDDASTDRTAAIADRMAHDDGRLRVLRRARNGGVCLARNDALKAARGRWVAFVDGDDEVAPERLMRMITEAERLRADWLADDQLVVGPGPRERPMRIFRCEPTGGRLIDLVHLIERDPPERIGYGTLKPLVRRSFLIRTELSFRPGLERYEDFVFHVECGLHGARMALLNEPLYHYRRRAGSLTAIDPLRTLHEMLHQNAAALAATRGRSVTAAAALKRRERLIRRAIEYRILLGSLARGRLGEVAAALRQHPASGLSLVRGLSRAAGRRLGVVAQA